MSGFHRPTAYHEARHVVGYCALLNGIYVACICPDGSHVDRSGREVHSMGGITEGSGSFDHHLLGLANLAKMRAMGCPADILHSVRERGLRDITIDLMGPYAEARYRKCGADYVMLSGGRCDMKRVKKIARWLASGDVKTERALVDQTESRARQLVSKHWSHIVTVAEHLVTHGKMGFKSSLGVGHALGSNRNS